jgi:hypothetical protein
VPPEAARGLSGAARLREVRRGRRGALGLVAVLAICVAGCGGSSDGTEETISGSPGPNASTGLTMPEFIAAADAICAEENQKLKPKFEALEAAGQSAKSQGELDDLLDQARAYSEEVEAGTSRLRTLPPPRGKVDAIDAMLTASSASQLAVVGLFEALAEDDRSKMAREKKEVELLQEKYRGLAQGLGFHECGAR